MTRIEWAEKTWNPVTGCTKVSAGCKNCYAEKMHKRLGLMGQEKYQHDFGVTRLHPKTLEDPIKRKKSTTYFVNSMADLFHREVPTDFIAMVWQVMRECRQHTFQILTKRPAIMATVLADIKPLPNVSLGVSIEDQASANERIPLLLQTPAARWFVSCEPLLSAVTFRPYCLTERPCSVCLVEDSTGRKRGEFSHPINCGWRQDAARTGEIGAWMGDKACGIDWVIVGCEKGPNRRPMDIDWARSLRDQCNAAGVPFFLKQMEIDGRVVSSPELDGRQWLEVPK